MGLEEFTQWLSSCGRLRLRQERLGPDRGPRVDPFFSEMAARVDKEGWRGGPGDFIISS
jgi:hypothetical protein